jgi:hypothetical protein
MQMKRCAILLLLVWGCATAHRESEIVLPPAHLEGIHLEAKSAEELGIESAEELARLLESRWTVSRIQAFTANQPEVQSFGRSGRDLDEADWTGELHIGQGIYSRIYFRTYISGGERRHFHVAAVKGNRSWVLEAGKLEDLFKHRIIHLREGQSYELLIPKN